MSDSDEEMEKPPERRAPSGRGNKGSRMAKLIAEEVDEEEDGDADFYKQESLHSHSTPPDNGRPHPPLADPPARALSLLPPSRPLLC